MNHDSISEKVYYNANSRILSIIEVKKFRKNGEISPASNSLT